MESLIVIGEEATFFYPSISFNAATGICEIVGESYLEETYAFYKPAIDWLEKYTSEKIGPVFFQMKITYFNTASSKIFVEMFEILKTYQDNGGFVSLVWYYHEWDSDMLTEVEDFIIDTGMEIQTITF